MIEPKRYVEVSESDDGTRTAELYIDGEKFRGDLDQFMNQLKELGISRPEDLLEEARSLDVNEKIYLADGSWGTTLYHRIKSRF